MNGSISLLVAGLIGGSLLFASCFDAASPEQKKSPVADPALVNPDNQHTGSDNETVLEAHPDSIVSFARTLIGVPYLYASTDPSKGFDCSGFITYVFNHFGLKVPRSSVDFTNYGSTINETEAQPGDLILFTGTDSTVRIVGHMGIVESWRNDSLYFIHSTSGKMKGVVITPLGKYYTSRFVKIIRVFNESYFRK